jgi:hypothetical protein
VPEQYQHHRAFINLFGGYNDSAAIGAYGTGTGRWVKRPLTPFEVSAHLAGEGPGIGVPPLRPDNTVVFAAIDLDEPAFDCAREMQQYIPGTSFIERSRSGNAHVWVFFSGPIEAYIPMGILRDATVAVGKKGVEVFPKNHDFARVKLGNYINLPYHGTDRPILWPADSRTPPDPERTMLLADFIGAAEQYKQDPDEWRKKARWLQIMPPERREHTADFGSQQQLHMCGQYIIDNALDGTNPVLQGSRSIVYFNLSKMLLNWSAIDEGDAWETLQEVNEASPDNIDERELRRIFDNAVRGQFTSTGCDDPVMASYVHPDCPIVARSN